MKLTKEQYDALPEIMKGLCVADGDGYILAAKSQKEYDDDIAGLKNNNAKLLEEKRAAAEKAKADELAAKTAADELARKNGDVAALDKSYGEKIAKLIADHEQQVSTYRNQVNTLKIDDVAKALAVKLGGANASDVFLPHIKARLSLEEVDGQFNTRILGTDGKPSAMSIDELEKEFRGNKAFAGVLQAPGNSGLGGGLNNPGAGGKPLGETKPETGGYNLSRDAMTARALEISRGVSASE